MSEVVSVESEVSSEKDSTLNPQNSTLYIETLGCKVNQYESSCIADSFVQAGWSVTDDMRSADVIVINTCAVTNRTDYKSRYLIKKAVEEKSLNPAVKVVITGCYSQKHKEELRKSGFIDLVIDNNDKCSVYLILQSHQQSVLHNQDTGHWALATTMSDRSRAFLKIQDGCDCECAYCVVPSVRGEPTSRSLESILAQVELFLDNGYSEIVLSGINLGKFGMRNAECGMSAEAEIIPSLHELLYTLSSYDKLKRIRLSSIEPQLWTDELFKAVSEIDKVCAHFHIPLQSGSDTLLALHKRRYTTAQFRDLVDRLQSVKPDCALGFDVIVGLPGETDELFSETYDFLKSIDFTYLHTFIYSKRKDTPAATMAGQVHGAVAKERSRRMIDLAKKKKDKYIKRLIEKQVMLWAMAEVGVRCSVFGIRDNIYSGTSDRYVKVFFQHKLTLNSPPLKLIPIKLYNDGIFCEVIQ